MDKYPHSILVEEGSFRAKINASKLFQKLTKAVQAFFPSGMTKASVVGAQEIITLGDTSQASHRAFELVLNALHNAGIKLIQSELHQLKDIDKQHTLKFEIKQEVNAFQLHITSEFFDSPEDLPLLKPIAIWFKEWFECLGFTEEIADELKRKLPDYFFKELIKEWGKRREYYQSIETELQSPFAKAWERKYNMLKYQDELRELFKQGAMGDKLLPLSKIYIEPYFSVHASNYIDRYKNNYYAEFIHDLPFEGTIHDYIHRRLVSNETHLRDVEAEKGNLIFLLGQPGQGKTSFCFCVLHRLLKNPNFEKKLYFVRLKELDSDKLINQPINTISDHIKKSTQLDFKTNNTILILDGLDEIYMSQGVVDADLANFYYKIEQEVNNSKDLIVILTSRYNYLNISAINKKTTTILKLKGLFPYQQKEWLSIYKKSYPNCKLTSGKISEINTNENLKHLNELIEQPILLHMIASVNIDIDNNLNRSAIYELLFDALLKRSWDKKEGQLKKYENLQEYTIEYRNWLQEIAFTIYQSDFEYVHKKKLLKLETTEVVLDGIKTSEALGEALKDLLVAFYFKNTKVHEDDYSELGIYKDAIEFLHKSLQEYLAAEYIWNKIVTEVLEKRAKNKQFILKIQMIF